MRRTPRNGPGGFVISLELILIVTFLVIGSLVGVIAVRNALFQLAAAKRALEVVVKDADDPPLRVKPVSYDLCEAPEILCPDPGFDEDNFGMAATPGPSEGLFALVGVRATHLVSRNRIYYAGTDCAGGAFLAPPAAPDPPASPGVFPPELPVGYFNCALQVDDAGDRVCYGVGPPSNWPCTPLDATAGAGCADGGRLYRSESGAAVTLATIRSRWISLNPDCATVGGGGGAGGAGGGGGVAGPELVANGSFEAPAFGVNGAFSPPPPTSWTTAATAGHWDPCVMGDPPCTSGGFVNDDFTMPPPDGVQIAFSNGSGGFPGTPDLSQSVSLTSGDTCTLSVWIGCRADGACAGGGTRMFNVDLRDATSASELGSVISGSVGPGSPQWTQFTRVFTVTGPTPHLITLDSSATQTNFDDVSLTCVAAGGGGGGGGAASLAICENIADTVLGVVPAVEVTQMDGSNVLVPFTPLFNVMPPLDPTVTYTPAVPEDAPIQDATAPGSTTTPGADPTFPDASPEDDPP